MKKRMLSLLLVLALALGWIPGVSAAAQTAAPAAVQMEDDVEIDPGMGVDPSGQPRGDGSPEMPFEISSAEELAWFAQLISDTEQQAQEACAVLTQDIDLLDEPWTPMGSYTHGYQGTFDGQGHKIMGLYVSGAEYAGLFACVDGGTVENLVVSGSVGGTGSVGAIAGMIKNSARISGCGNETQISGTGTYTAGIVGSAGTYGKLNTIERCYNAGSVQASGSYAGGILAYDQGKASITDCYNTGSVTSGNYAGGIRGYLSSMAGKITNCYNIGTISGKKAGAIVSGSYDGENCYALQNGEIVLDGGTEKLTKQQLLTALQAQRDDVWKHEPMQNGGYPLLSWQEVQKVEGDVLLAQDVKFVREIFSVDGEETSLPTAELTWSAADGATGYMLALWQKVRVWKSLTQQELDALTKEPEGPVDSWSRRLLNLDQDAILSKFTDEQTQELLALQTQMDEKFQTYCEALEEKLNASTEVEYEKANQLYMKTLAEYDAAYQACCKYIILQAVADGLSLGDYWSELTFATSVKLDKDQTSYDCTGLFAELEDGVYYAAVSVIGKDGAVSLGNAEQINRDVVGFQDPYTRMKPITGLSWSGSVASWTGKDYFTEDQSYRLDLYEYTENNYRFIKSFEVAGDVTQADFRNAFTAQRSYAFTVTAVADETLNTTRGLHDSITSAMSPVYTPGGGSSEEKDWVDISSAEQWMEIANTKDELSDPSNPDSQNKQDIEWSKNYRLVADLDFSELSAKDQNRTKSIGSKTYMFQGEFDGNGHEIRGLTLSNSDSGLFAFVGSESYIHDVKIINPNVYFSGTAAVLVLNNYGIIEDCAVIGCNISADISGVMGGLAGRNYGIIRECYVRGGRLDSNTTTATGHAGFVGSNEESGLIERCWTSMDVHTQSDYAGGFVGLCYGGVIRDCFALGDVTARGYSGGFVGRSVYSGNTYENCYAAGTVSCTGEEGHGFIGGNKPDSSFQYDQSEGITNCYYNQDSEEATENYGAKGLPLSEMRSDNFRKQLGTRWSRNSSLNDGLPYLTGVEIPTPLEEDSLDVTIVLARYNTETYSYERFGEKIELEMTTTGNTRVCDVMDEAVRQGKLTYGYETTSMGRYVSTINGRELLAPNGWMFTINGVLSNLGVSTATVEAGDTILWYEGMTQNHFRAPSEQELDAGSGYWTEIGSAQELAALAQSSDPETLAGNYCLTKDIDLQGMDFSGIGSESAPFTGTFDGRGYTISNLTMQAETNAGLFRVVRGGTIKNLTLRDVRISGSKNVGAVAGQMQVVLNTQSMAGSIAGLIGNVHVTGTISGSDATGGIAGLNDGKQDTDTSYSVASAIDRSSFEGSVTGLTATGGLVGRNNGAVTASSAEGTVDAGDSGRMAGGAAGENDGDIYDSHTNVRVSAQSYVGGFVGSGSGSVRNCYSLGNVSGGGYVGGFAGMISNVDTAVSVGRVSVTGSDGQGYAGGFAGHLGGEIVGTTAWITVKNVYGYCLKEDGTLLRAAGRTNYTQTSEGLERALEAMILATPEEAEAALKTVFDLDYKMPRDEQDEDEQAAQAVEELIAALPAAEALTPEDGEAVDAAQAAYDALSEKARDLVGEESRAKLALCVSRIEELRRQPLDPVEQFRQLMELVPAKNEDVKSTDAAAIENARACYNGLDKAQQKEVKTLYTQLTAAEKTCAKNQKAADKVDTQIEKLPESVASITLRDEKSIKAADKAYQKLTDAQKSFVKEERAAYLKQCTARMQVLLDNEKQIEEAEKLIKKLPAASKIKASDEEKLLEARERVDALEAGNLPIDEALLQKLEESERAFENGMALTQELREMLEELDPEKMDKIAGERYERAQEKYDEDKKLSQRFTTKEEQNVLKNCKSALKKNQSAAGKVEKQIEKLPDPDKLTAKNEKAVQKAYDAYEKLTEAQKTFVDGDLYQKLLDCRGFFGADEEQA